MAKTSKKVADAAPVAVVQDKKSSKKGGKRGAEVAVEKVVSAKKPKLVKEEALAAKKKAEAKVVVNNKDETSSASDVSEADSDEEPPKAAAVVAKKNGSVPAATKKAPVAKKAAAPKKAESSDESEEEEDEEESSEEEDDVATKAAPAAATEEDESDESGEEDDSEEEDESEDEKMVEATPVKANKKAEAPKTPVAAHENAGSKTLFIGNLSFKIEKENVEEFFKEVAEVSDVRFVSDSKGTFRGFGYAEFSSSEDAVKAMTLQGGDLLGRPVKLDFARERGAATPNTRDSSNKVAAEGSSAFIKGFNKSLDEDTLRSSLQEHFGECGEITRVSIPTDRETGASKGIAYIDFSSTSELAKALELNGSDLGGFSLVVDCAKPKDSGGRGGFSGGRGRGGRGGDRGGRGRGGRGGRRGGGRGFGSSGRRNTFSD